jgi:hypothetical protein
MVAADALQTGDDHLVAGLQAFHQLVEVGRGGEFAGCLVDVRRRLRRSKRWRARHSDRTRNSGATARIRRTERRGRTAPSRGPRGLVKARAADLAGRITESVAACRRAGAEGERNRRPEIVARAAVVVQAIGDPNVNRELEQLRRQAFEHGRRAGTSHPTESGGALVLRATRSR